jgi:hypothetical protein
MLTPQPSRYKTTVAPRIDLVRTTAPLFTSAGDAGHPGATAIVTPPPRLAVPSASLLTLPRRTTVKNTPPRHLGRSTCAASDLDEPIPQRAGSSLATSYVSDTSSGRRSPPALRQLVQAAENSRRALRQLPRSLALLPHERKQAARRLAEQSTAGGFRLPPNVQITPTRRIAGGIDRGRVLQRLDVEHGFTDKLTASRPGAMLVPLSPTLRRELEQSSSHVAGRCLVSAGRGIAHAADMGYEPYMDEARESSAGGHSRAPFATRTPTSIAGLTPIANNVGGALDTASEHTNKGQAGSTLADALRVHTAASAALVSVKLPAEEPDAGGEDEEVAALRRDASFVERFFHRVPPLSGEMLRESAADALTTEVATRSRVPNLLRAGELQAARTRLRQLLVHDLKHMSQSSSGLLRKNASAFFPRALVDDDVQLSLRLPGTKIQRQRRPTVTDVPKGVVKRTGAAWSMLTASAPLEVVDCAAPYVAIVDASSPASAALSPMNPLALQAAALAHLCATMSVPLSTHRLESSEEAILLQANTARLLYVVGDGTEGTGRTLLVRTRDGTTISLDQLASDNRTVIADLVVHGVQPVAAPGCGTRSESRFVIRHSHVRLDLTSPTRHAGLGSHYLLKALQGAAVDLSPAAIVAYIDAQVRRRFFPETVVAIDVDQHTAAVEPFALLNDAALFTSIATVKAHSKARRNVPVQTMIACLPSVVSLLSAPTMMTRVRGRLEKHAFDAQNESTVVNLRLRRHLDYFTLTGTVVIEGVILSRWANAADVLSQVKDALVGYLQAAPAQGALVWSLEDAIAGVEATELIEHCAAANRVVLSVPKRPPLMHTKQMSPLATELPHAESTFITPHDEVPSPAESEEDVIASAATEEVERQAVYEPARTALHDTWLYALACCTHAGSGQLRDSASALDGAVIRVGATMRFRGSAHAAAKLSKCVALGTLDIVSCCFCRLTGVGPVQDAAVDVEGDAAVAIQSWWRRLLAVEFVRPRHELAIRMLRKLRGLAQSSLQACAAFNRQLAVAYYQDKWTVLIQLEESCRATIIAADEERRVQFFDDRVFYWQVLEARCRDRMEREFLFGAVYAEALEDADKLHRDGAASAELINTLFATLRDEYRRRNKSITEEYAARAALREGQTLGAAAATELEQRRLLARTRVRQERHDARKARLEQQHSMRFQTSLRRAMTRVSTMQYSKSLSMRATSVTQLVQSSSDTSSADDAEETNISVHSQSQER